MYSTDINKAAEIIRNAEYAVAFTGSGVSAESRIIPLKDKTGSSEPDFLKVEYFKKHPKEAWYMIRKIFFDDRIKPNGSHHALALMEEKGFLKSVITHNIDGLHHQAGCNNVFEYHGTINSLKCIECDFIKEFLPENIKEIPPICPKCGSPLKPDFVFFGEKIPEETKTNTKEEIKKADVMIIAGADGEVMPISALPVSFKFPNSGIGGTIIEINSEETLFTSNVTDYFLKGKISSVLTKLTETVVSID